MLEYFWGGLARTLFIRPVAALEQRGFLVLQEERYLAVAYEIGVRAAAAAAAATRMLLAVSLPVVSAATHRLVVGVLRRTIALGVVRQLIQALAVAAAAAGRHKRIQAEAAGAARLVTLLSVLLRRLTLMQLELGDLGMRLLVPAAMPAAMVPPVKSSSMSTTGLRKADM